MWHLNASEAPCLIILISLAKNHFSLHAVDQNGKVILHKSVTRSKLLTTIANMHSQVSFQSQTKVVERKYAQFYIW